VNSIGTWSRKYLNYEFRDQALLELALTHKSLSSENAERLEFLGDSVLGFITAEALYHQEPDIDEGALSRKRSLLVKGETLTEMSREIGLDKVIRLSNAEKRAGGHQRSSVLEDSLEAVFGAVLLDGGIEAVKIVILGLFAERLRNLPDQEAAKDPKSRLQEALQAVGLELPHYRVEQEEGPDHAREFEVSCNISEHDLRTTGRGLSRQSAEQDAAAKALLLLADDS
jgi:ribonuclease III